MKLINKITQMLSVDVTKCSIDDLKKNINSSSLLMFIIIISSTLIALFVMHEMYVNEKVETDNQKVISALSVYQTNLSERLSVAASSTTFLDYVRSGDKTRESQYYHFATDMNRLQSNGLAGMEIIDSVNHKTIFSSGRKTNSSTTLRLCYLNDTLDGRLGDCGFAWKLYFDTAELIDQIKAINSDIAPCNNCVPYNFQSGNYLFNFPVVSGSNMKLYMRIKEAKDYFFYLYLILISISFVIFATWSWHRLSHLIHVYISKPIGDLTSCLEASETIVLASNLYEIQYLIDEINLWKERLKKVKEEENAAKISTIVAQFAHDVRSPLATINMIMYDMREVSSEYKNILISSVQRISDIANHFLNLYKNPNAVTEVVLQRVNIIKLFESIIAEKKFQYRQQANIEFHVSDNCDSIYAQVDESDLQRVISNLINNAVEACNKFSEIGVNLVKSLDYLLIEITDNGCGIPQELIPKIMKGGVSVGKTGGSGIGLAHAVNKVRGWFGELHISSVVGRGTTITIRLPLA